MSEERDNIMNVMSPEEMKAYLKRYFSEDENATFPLTVTGNSMSPFLTHLRDTAILAPFDKKASLGDILLFEYGERLILHRVTEVTENGIVFSGDANTLNEVPVPNSAVLARCVGVVRNGRVISEGDFLWRFYRNLRCGKSVFSKILLRLCGATAKK